MGDNFKQSVDVLELAIELTGQIGIVKFDSGVYKHCEYEYRISQYGSRNMADDIFTIEGTDENPITPVDIFYVFVKMQKQRENILVRRSFHYQGINYDEQTETWVVSWGS